MYNTSKHVPVCKGRFTHTIHRFLLGTVFSTTTGDPNWSGPPEPQLPRHVTHSGLEYEHRLADSKQFLVALPVTVHKYFPSPLLKFHLHDARYPVLFQLA